MLLVLEIYRVYFLCEVAPQKSGMINKYLKMATILIKHTPGYMNDVNRRPLHQQGVSRCYRLGKLVAKKSDWSTLKVTESAFVR